ncbi:MAG: aspartate kinase [Muribaculaceae bacterium]|nr:aspartate kinase [Muribaculaceae bacterium]MDE7080524.1 aspartate kinase [Muribaculaceae bacterium]
MIVLKFGGTSVGTAESLANVKKIVQGLGQDAVIVVSALGGLTDRLIATARMAAAGDLNYIPECEAMVQRHYDIVEAVVPEMRREHTLERIQPVLRELRRLYDGVNLIADLPEKTLAQIVSTGERMSSVIVADMLGASHLDSLGIIRTEKWFGKDIAATDLTSDLIREALRNADLTYPVVMGGFISSDRQTGEITNLGRGGSDYTAALVAAAMDADVLQIWTDVDGFLTCDPRIVPQARVIDSMSFVESMDLCTFGAKVIYPPTIYPVFHKNIPIRILNTHRPEAPGTFISDAHCANPRTVTGLSALKDEALVTLRGPLATDSTAISTRCFNALARKGLTLHMVARSEAAGSFAFAIAAADMPCAVKLLKEEFAPEFVDAELEVLEVVTDLTTIAVVGDDVKNLPGGISRLKEILETAGVTVRAYSDRTSETALSLVVPVADTTRALAALHRDLFEDL